MDVFALRGALSAVTGLKQLPNAVRGDLAAKSARVSENAESLKTSIEKLATLLPASADVMRDAANKHIDSASDFSGIVEEGLILTDHAQPIGSEAFELGTKSYESAAHLNSVLMPLLQQNCIRGSALPYGREISRCSAAARYYWSPC